MQVLPAAAVHINMAVPAPTDRLNPALTLLVRSSTAVTTAVHSRSRPVYKNKSVLLVHGVEGGGGGITPTAVRRVHDQQSNHFVRGRARTFSSVPFSVPPTHPHLPPSQAGRQISCPEPHTSRPCPSLSRSLSPPRVRPPREVLNPSEEEREGERQPEGHDMLLLLYTKHTA